MLSLSQYSLCLIPSAGFSTVFLAGAGVMQTTKVVVGGWRQQQVEGWKGKMS